MEMRIEQMWRNGPLRRFTRRENAPKGCDGGERYTSEREGLDGWAGAYVCGQCKADVSGVYQQGPIWVGACCRK
jgi:hypothetical protein